MRACSTATVLPAPAKHLRSRWRALTHRLRMVASSTPSRRRIKRQVVSVSSPGISPQAVAPYSRWQALRAGWRAACLRAARASFNSEAALLDALGHSPDSFRDRDIAVVRYEGPRGAPGMPEMLDPTSRITTLCRQRQITIGLMTDGRF